MTFTDWRADQKEPSAIRPYILLDSAHGFQWNGRENTDDNNNGYICKKIQLVCDIKIEMIKCKQFEILSNTSCLVIWYCVTFIIWLDV